jgi:hypothetical protein
MSLENKNETLESSVLERENEQIPNKETAEDASKFLEGIKTDSILALAEFSKQIERDRETISKDTEHGKEALVKLDEITEVKKQIEEELIDDIILWHGSGWSGITLENLSIDRLSGDTSKFSETRYKSSASSHPEYYGFYTSDSMEVAKKYTGVNSMMVQDEYNEFEKDYEDNKISDIRNQADLLYYYMITKKVSYKEAINIYEQELEEPVNQLFKEKQYSLDELGKISTDNDFNRLYNKKIEESKLKSTLYKLYIEKGAKIGSLKEVFGDGFNKMIQKLRKEDFDKAREQGYDIITDGPEYAVLNKEVIKKIDKSERYKTEETNQATGETIYKNFFPGFEDK